MYACVENVTPARMSVRYSQVVRGVAGEGGATRRGGARRLRRPRPLEVLVHHEHVRVLTLSNEQSTLMSSRTAILVAGEANSSIQPQLFTTRNVH